LRHAGRFNLSMPMRYFPNTRDFTRANFDCKNIVSKTPIQVFKPIFV